MAKATRDDKFAWGANVVLTQCILCKHIATGMVFACAAFPGSIPDEIVHNEYDHRKPWIDPATGEPGDMGVPLERSIVFQPKDGMNPVTLKALYRHLDSID